MDKCFQLHGYPPGWNGPKGKRIMASAHAAITTPEVPNQNIKEQQKFCFTPEEFHKLVALANSVQPNSSNQNNVQPAVNLVTTSHFSGKVQPTLKPIFSCNSVTSKPNSTSYWLLDTGATDHMICSPLLYHSTPKPINASINLPNGTTVPATHIGTVCLSDSLFLHNDQSMEKMIGIALEKEGLYHLIPASSQAKTCNSFQFNSAPLALSSIHKHFDIWHCRLGHVSSSRFHSLKQIDSAITLDHTNVCHICPLAKQRRLPFSVSQIDDFTRCTWVYMIKAKS
ncbi:hypothetical protein CK203_059841 [Vitis vinifera]|uniref:GAG-pre-integrase domain-containing protein n=1 Tax=Vitis vinifera TaxID=29760 RepID=A0A438GG15_VITVI|nr:hypothetical protein CK203_059841 [Vitis vinifera]